MKIKKGDFEFEGPKEELDFAISRIKYIENGELNNKERVTRTRNKYNLNFDDIIQVSGIDFENEVVRLYEKKYDYFKISMEIAKKLRPFCRKKIYYIANVIFVRVLTKIYLDLDKESYEDIIKNKNVSSILSGNEKLMAKRKQLVELFRSMKKNFGFHSGPVQTVDAIMAVYYKNKLDNIEK